MKKNQKKKWAIGEVDKALGARLVYEDKPETDSTRAADEDQDTIAELLVSLVSTKDKDDRREIAATIAEVLSGHWPDKRTALWEFVFDDTETPIQDALKKIKRASTPPKPTQASSKQKGARNERTGKSAGARRKA